MKLDVQSWPDLFVVRELFDEKTCHQLIYDMQSASGAAASVYGRTAGGSVETSARSTFRLNVSSTSLTLVQDQLQLLKPQLENHFEVTLSKIEEPQFLRYRTGDFFVAHQDGNTGLTNLETEKRLVSVVIFLSRESSTPEPGAFSGGSLMFTDLLMRYDRVSFPADVGTLVAFRSETTHEVTPVVDGERLSIASWYR